jgi:hypothetical protein
VTRSRLRASVTWGISVAVLAVFATYLWALVGNRSRSIPGVVDVLVVDTEGASAVEVSAGVGLVGFAAALVGLAWLLHGRRRAP